MRNKPERVIESAYLAVLGKFEECLSSQGIKPNIWQVMEILDENPGLTLKELSRQSDIKIPALSKLVDRMVRNALIHRKQSSVDRRSIQLFISDHGRETLQKCLPEVRAFRESIAELLDSHTQSTLAKLARMNQESAPDSTASKEHLR